MNDRRESPEMTFVPGTAVAGADLDRMAGLLFETSYLEYCSVANRLGLPPRQLQRRQNIDPWLERIVALYEGTRLAGFYNAATLAQYAATPAINHYRDEVQAMDAAYDAFVARYVGADELFVGSLAIEPSRRSRGLLDVLLADVERTALAQGCAAVCLTVWQSSAALPMYQRRGFTLRGTFDDAYPLFFDRLHCMARPLLNNREES
jgi:GNAT superfamily N-acetyltransferase